MPAALPDDPSDWTVDALAAAYADGTASPVEIARRSFDRVREVDPAVNAFVWVDEDGALAQARESEARWRAGEQLGDLDGVPVTDQGPAAVRRAPDPQGLAALGPVRAPDGGGADGAAAARGGRGLPRGYDDP